MRKIEQIIVHCSDSEFGTVLDIDKWHKERGWAGCGYHYVITNGVTVYAYAYDNTKDGILQRGREDETIGAHAKGHNKESLGICLIGKSSFTPEQLLVSLPKALAELMVQYKLDLDDVVGHRSLTKSKTCPNFDVDLIKPLVKQYLGRRKYGRHNRVVGTKS